MNFRIRRGGYDHAACLEDRDQPVAVQKLCGPGRGQPSRASSGCVLPAASCHARREKRRVHTPESEEKLGKQLAKLARLCPNSRAALRVQAVLTVCYFVPNDLPDTDDRWGLGDYVTVTGLLRALSPVSETLLVGETLIPFREIWSLRCLSLNTPLRAAVPGTACSTRA